MTTLSNNDKSITINFETPIKRQEVLKKQTVYTVKLPEITCDNENDALQIQQQVNEFVNTIVRDLLKDKE